RGKTGKGRPLRVDEIVDRHRLGLRIEARELRDQARALRARLAHSDDPAAADLDSRPAYALERLEAVTVFPRGDDVAIELRGGVEGVVVVVQARGLQGFGRTLAQEAERRARLQPPALDRPHPGRGPPPVLFPP